jgi:hypothetical protein
VAVTLKTEAVELWDWRIVPRVETRSPAIPVLVFVSTTIPMIPSTTLTEEVSDTSDP